MADPGQLNLGENVQAASRAWDLLVKIFSPLCACFMQEQMSYRDRRANASADASFYGAWDDVAAFDENRSRVPILAKDLFRLYMLEQDGHFKPNRQSKATAEWVNLVHALGIMPATKVLDSNKAERRVVDFRNPKEAELVLPKTQIKMDLDGEVLCHIVNLFEDLDLPWGQAKQIEKREDKGSAKTPFANITWNATKPRQPASYDLRGGEAISSDRCPFGQVGKLMRAGSCIRAYYYNAISDPSGCSDLDLKWPSADLSLRERIQSLKINLAKAMYRTSPDSIGYRLLIRPYKSMHKPDLNNPDPPDHITKEAWKDLQGYIAKCASGPQPLLLTYTWLESANRIRRRATSNGGYDSSFLQDVNRNIDKGKWPQDLASILKELYPSSYSPKLLAKEIDLLKAHIKSGFFFHDDSYSYELVHGPEPRKISELSGTEMRVDMANEIILYTLEEYRQAKTGSWQRSLFEARHEVADLILSRHIVSCDYAVTRVLTFRPEAKLWDMSFQISSADETQIAQMHEELDTRIPPIPFNPSAL
jgi:hypothetical protein